MSSLYQMWWSTHFRGLVHHPSLESGRLWILSHYRQAGPQKETNRQHVTCYMSSSQNVARIILRVPTEEPAPSLMLFQPWIKADKQSRNSPLFYALAAFYFLDLFFPLLEHKIFLVLYRLACIDKLLNKAGQGAFSQISWRTISERVCFRNLIYRTAEGRVRHYIGLTD